MVAGVEYACTRSIVGHIFSEVDGEMGNKKVYDPRSYKRKAEAGMSQRVVEAREMLKSAGNTIA